MQKSINRLTEWLAGAATIWAGTPWAFLTAILAILVWVISGPIFGYSDTWQLIANTGTTLVTFLMVFLIQRSQNKESLAIQLKLNELILSNDKASNKMINIESLTETEIRELHSRFVALTKEAGSNSSSIDNSPKPPNSVMKWMH